MSDISIEIGHVVLDRVSAQSPRSSEHFGRMSEMALQRLLEQQGLPSGWTGRDVAELTGLSVQVPRGASEEQIAREVALVLYRALTNAGGKNG
jgi:hypothetical protein